MFLRDQSRKLPPADHPAPRWRAYHARLRCRRSPFVRIQSARVPRERTMSASRICQPRVRARSSALRSVFAKLRRYLSPCIRLPDKSSLAAERGTGSRKRATRSSHPLRTLPSFPPLFFLLFFPVRSSLEPEQASATRVLARDPHASIALFFLSVFPAARPGPLVHHRPRVTHFRSCFLFLFAEKLSRMRCCWTPLFAHRRAPFAWFSRPSADGRFVNQNRIGGKQ